MQKFLIALFVVTLLITGLLLAAFFNYKKQATTIQEPAVGLKTEDLGVPKARLLLEPPRQIQALFVRVEAGKLHFNNKLALEKGEQSIDIGSPTIYVCIRPQETEAISLDFNEPNIALSLLPEELNQRIESNESIFISTLKTEEGKEEVNFVAAAKCSGL